MSEHKKQFDREGFERLKRQYDEYEARLPERLGKFSINEVLRQVKDLQSIFVEDLGEVRYVTGGLKPSSNLCQNCQDHNNGVYELQDPDELRDMFPYGEWLDEDTFAVILHPNCVCLVVRDHDVYW